MKIALAQMSMARDMGRNFDKALKIMEEAAGNGAALLCFPELQFSPFFPQHPGKDASGYLMDKDHAFVRGLLEKGAELNLALVPNFYLAEGDGRYDASPVMDARAGIMGIAKMVHIAQLPRFYEKDYYTPSDSGFCVENTLAGRIGVVICFDRHFPESIRACAAAGAEIIVIPTANTRDEPLEMFEWEMRVAAMQNTVFIAMANRVGVEDAMDFAGESLVIGPDGDVIVKAGDGEGIVYGEVNFSRIALSRRKRPYLSLLRPQWYAANPLEPEGE